MPSSAVRIIECSALQYTLQLKEEGSEQLQNPLCSKLHWISAKVTSTQCLKDEKKDSLAFAAALTLDLHYKAAFAQWDHNQTHFDIMY